MRRLLIALLVVSTSISLSGQKSIDRLFDKYGDDHGFVTIKFNGSLLKFIRSCDDEEDSLDKLPSEITEIRILAQQDSGEVFDNFFDRVMHDINRDEYEEFMRVKKPDENMVMLVRAEGNRFREFLLVAGGKDNVLIQIKGDITFKEAKKLSEESESNCTLNLVSVKN